MWNLVLSTGDLDQPPLSLRELTLVNIDGMERLPEAPALESLSLRGWKTLQPASLEHCDSLRELHMDIAAVVALPDGWLVNCSRLEMLEIHWAFNQTTIPTNLLLGMTALTHLDLRGGSFETLPVGLLDHSPNLRMLRLNSNRLRALPSDMFAVAQKVQEVDLSLNELKSDAMDALAPLKELIDLNLGHNPYLGDVCKADGNSAISNSTQLAKLKLLGTGLTRLCKDWQEDMTLLAELVLTSTNVSQLLFEDLHFTRTVKAKVFLPFASLSTVEMTREDYHDAARRLPSGATVYFNEVSDCDCRLYWTRRALDLPFIDINGLLCTNMLMLRDVPPEDMVCARPEECSAAALPDACACAARPDDDSSHDRLLVRVRCEYAALTRVPRPRAINDSTERVYELLLAHNNITDIHADDVQDNIKGLDLRYNSLERVDEETARRLGDVDGILRLAGNPLDCSCRNVPLLRALYARNATQIDLSNVTCSNGSKLYAAYTINCLLPVATLGTWLAGALAVLLTLVAAVMALLVSRERRFFARAVLHRWGFEWRAAEPEDDGRRYDAFITFSHKDQAVVHELMARLEPDYRLCIHERDWTPGCYIVEQIVESVRESRRTVALVSRHFLASSWARAEFREAHTAAMLDARPRLVVVLLEEPTALEMDEQLRRYVTTQTYLRWGENWFWDKLAVALPRPRAPPPDPAAPPAAPPALELVPVRPTDTSASPSTVSASS